MFVYKVFSMVELRPATMRSELLNLMDVISAVSKP